LYARRRLFLSGLPAGSGTAASAQVFTHDSPPLKHPPRLTPSSLESERARSSRRDYHHSSNRSFNLGLNAECARARAHRRYFASLRGWDLWGLRGEARVTEFSYAARHRDKTRWFSRARSIAVPLGERSEFLPTVLPNAHGMLNKCPGRNVPFQIERCSEISDQETSAAAI